ncbi:MAG: GNAT family N-acetyltransferase, partial [Proteobacteria bacterium]
FGAKPAAEVLICELKDPASGKWTNAGFALFFTSFSTFLGLPGIYLEDLFIKPEARSSGLGKKMLVELARLTLDRGYGRLEWSVLDWNVRARKFYEELGAKPMDEWTVHRVSGDSLQDLAKF